MYAQHLDTDDKREESKAKDPFDEYAQQLIRPIDDFDPQWVKVDKPPKPTLESMMSQMEELQIVPHALNEI